MGREKREIETKEKRKGGGKKGEREKQEEFEGNSSLTPTHVGSRRGKGKKEVEVGRKGKKGIEKEVAECTSVPEVLGLRPHKNNCTKNQNKRGKKAKSKKKSPLQTDGEGESIASNEVLCDSPGRRRSSGGEATRLGKKHTE